MDFKNVKDGITQLNNIGKESCNECVHFEACKMIFSSAFPKERIYNHVFVKACRLFKNIKNYKEVVLCGECAKYDPESKICEEFVSDPLPTGGRICFQMESDSFCSLGERR